ncbi:MAG TPA: hypothetical protein ENK58_09420 [Desulfobacterales bacterium]|nr:hypothetical protein [Desulfobacterales bacterium]
MYPLPVKTLILSKAQTQQISPLPVASSTGQWGVFILVFGAVFVIPFLFSASTTDPVLVPRFLALSVLTLILTFMISAQTLTGQNRSDFVMVYRAIFPVGLCYLFISAVSLTKAVNLTEGIFEWLKHFLFLTFFYIATLIIGNNKNTLLILTKSMTVAGMALAFMGICQYYQMAFTFIPGNCEIYATMAHKNLFASALFLTSPFVLYGAFRFPGCWKMISLTSVAFILFSLIISKTRSVWGATGLSAVIVLLLAVYAHKSNLRSKYAFVLFACIFSFVALFCFKYLPVANFDSLNERILLWEKTLGMIRENPILGVGSGQWKIMLPHYGRIERWRDSDGESGEVWFQRPHNDYLWVFSETGFPGFISYLSFFLILIAYILRTFFQSEDREEKCFSLLMLFGILGYMIIAFFSFPKERIVHNIFLMLTAACIVSEYHQLSKGQRAKDAPNKRKSYTGFQILNLILSVVLIFCATFGYFRLNAEIHAKKALSARNAGQWEKVISEIDKVDSRFYNMDPFSTPLSWYRGVANFSMGNIGEALEDFKMAYKIHPNHIHVLHNTGTCYALSGDYVKAAEFYQKTLVIFPQFEESLDNLKKIETKAAGAGKFK